MDIQVVIVAVIVLGAAFFLARKFRRVSRHKERCGGCDCCGQGPDNCPTGQNKHKG